MLVSPAHFQLPFGSTTQSRPAGCLPADTLASTQTWLLGFKLGGSFFTMGHQKMTKYKQEMSVSTQSLIADSQAIDKPDNIIRRGKMITMVSSRWHRSHAQPWAAESGTLLYQGAGRFGLGNLSQILTFCHGKIRPLGFLVQLPPNMHFSAQKKHVVFWANYL